MKTVEFEKHISAYLCTCRDHYCCEINHSGRYVRAEVAERLLDVSKTLSKVIKQLMDGEQCDHSVGVCYCDVYEALDSANAAIKQAEEG